MFDFIVHVYILVEKKIVEEIKAKIESGEFELIKRKSKSEVFNLFMDIKNSEGEILKTIVICDRCKNFYKCRPFCTSNLVRHNCYKKYKMDKENFKVKMEPNKDLKKVCSIDGTIN